MLEKIHLIITFILVYFFIKDKFTNIEKATNTENIREQIKQVYQADVQAIKNLGDIASSMITEDGTLTLPYNVNITGDLTTGGNLNMDETNYIYVGNFVLGRYPDSNYTEFAIKHKDSEWWDGIRVNNEGYLKVNDDLYVGGDLNVDGNGIIGSAYIGKWKTTNNGYAAFCHKDRKESNNYSILSQDNGYTYISTSDTLYIRKNNTNGVKLNVQGNTNITGNLKVDNHIQWYKSGTNYLGTLQKNTVDGANIKLKNKHGKMGVDIYSLWGNKEARIYVKDKDGNNKFTTTDGGNVYVAGTIEAWDAKFNVVSKEKAKWYSTHRHNHHGMTTRSPTY